MQVIPWIPLSLFQYLAIGALAGVAAVYVTATSAIALLPTAATVLAGPILAMWGVTKLAAGTVEVVSGFTGFGNKFPKCCCLMVNSTVDSIVNGTANGSAT